MMRNPRLARAIADVGWSGLVTKLEAKLKAQGGHLVRVDRFFPSSKTCSRCGAKNADLTLKDRTWTCAACGTTHDRDVNAAINIRQQGILQLKGRRTVGLCPWRRHKSILYRDGCCLRRRRKERASTPNTALDWGAVPAPQSPPHPLALEAAACWRILRAWWAPMRLLLPAGRKVGRQELTV
jgi:hypothetical protein